ncbi:MAG TPA: mechanosensitive ion channel family protein, partial [Planctomycetota bacterium]|nr:mechanosensitive ion channel family protein [Planctomycetota bacterium]
MPILKYLLEEAVDDRTLWVAIALLLVITLLRALKSEGRRNIRSMVILFLLHLVLLPVAAALRISSIFEVDPATQKMVCKAGFYPEAAFAARFFAALCAVQIAGVVLFDLLGPAVRIRAPRIVRDIILGFCSVIAAFLVLSSYTDTSKLFTASALVTAVLGISLADTLGNILGGIALQLDNSISIGDWVKIGDPIAGLANGRVVDIRWRYTAIETRNWETIIVPNSVLMKGQVSIIGRRTDKPVQWRRWVWFNVDFRYPPTQVIQVVEQAVRAAPIPGVAADPEPNAVLMDMAAESYGKYAIRYWLTDLPRDDPTDSIVRQRVYFALKRAGIPLSIPAQTVFATMDEPERRERKAEAEMARRAAALARVDLFHHLAEEDRAHLAARLIPAPFARNETLTKQGAEAHWLYMITAGEVSVRVAVDGGLEKEVAKLKDGSFFGEMSLMTGAPRSATVVALTDVECYKLDSKA